MGDGAAPVSKPPGAALLPKQQPPPLTTPAPPAPKLVVLKLDAVKAAIDAIKSAAVADEFFDATKAQFKAESDRSSALDAKAASLLSVIGFCLTVITSVGALLVDKTKNFPSGARGLLAAGCAGALLAGLMAAAYAVKAVKIRGFREPAVNVILQDAVMSAMAATDEKIRKATYRLQLAEQLWICWDQNFSNNEQKSRSLATAQYWFTGFILAVGGLAIAMAVIAKVYIT